MGEQAPLQRRMDEVRKELKNWPAWMLDTFKKDNARRRALRNPPALRKRAAAEEQSGGPKGD